MLIEIIAEHVIHDAAHPTVSGFERLVGVKPVAIEHGRPCAF